MSDSSGSFVLCSDATSSRGQTPCHDDDPPVIVGMACRLPGDITSPAGFWDFLLRNGCAQGPVPKARFNNEAYYHPEGGGNNRAGLMDVYGGYFLNEDVRSFDNGFFGIHNLEAASMDPQQRKLLEIVYEAFENSGTSMDGVSGSNTGIFVGNFTMDHQTMQSRDTDTIHRFSASGCGTSIMANRISHIFNLQGPSYTLDTACSSSIYALHNAVTALEAGDCDAAVVAAVNLIMSPEQCVAAAKSGVLSATSTCHTFDTAADGYGRAEGMNAIYVKRLSSALRDGDKVWAVVRGTAVNANGKTPGITQPSATLQEAVIRKAYQKAGLDFADSDYVECHGTGTPVGDPIEADALGRCFKNAHRAQPLLIGSSKPGLGHSEAASGLTALIKMALALDKGKIPPTYGVKNLNPKLELEAKNMKVATQVEDWPRDLRRASINAFGYGGANAHAILEGFSSYMGNRAPATPELLTYSQRDQLFLLPVSAASSHALDKRLTQIRQIIDTGDVETVERLAYTLAERTSHLSSRAILFAKAAGMHQKPELLDLDVDLGAAQSTSGNLPVALVFTGQGAQYANMGKELLESNEIFAAAIRSLDHSLKTLPPQYAPDWTLEESILDPPEVSQIHQASRSQPVCTAIQIALVDLLQSWRINPCAVVGHSSGEIAAAYAAGLMSARKAIMAAYFRGFAVGKLTSKGTMLAAGMHADEARELIQKAKLDDVVTVACINSPESVTLSGSMDGIDQMMKDIKAQGKFARKLRTGDRAYHSFMMQEVGGLYEKLLTQYLDTAEEEDLTEPSKTVMYSSVIANGEDQASVLTKDSVSARYWRDNLEQPVQFSLALSTVLANNKKVHLVEVGPSPALKGPVKQIRSHMKRDLASVPYSGTLVRDQDADLCMKQLAGDFFLRHQKSLTWQYVNCLKNPTFSSDLPPYPWDYSAGLLWQEPRASVELRNRKHRRHELLGSQQVAGNGIDWSWRNIVNLGEIPWVRDHKLESQIVFPAAGYLAMAVEALSQTRQTSSGKTPAFEFRHVNISAALVVPDDDSRGAIELHTSLSASKISTASVSKDWSEFSIASWVGGQSTLHCSGSIRMTEDEDNMALAETVTVPESTGFEEWPNMSIWYDRFAGEGLRFGPTFQSVQKLKTDAARSRSDATSTTRLVPAAGEGEHDTKYPMHPITIDACIQVAIMGSASGDVSETHVFLPVFIDECRIRSSASADKQALGLVQATSHKTSPSTRRMASTLWSTDAEAVPLIHMQGVRVTQYKTDIVQDSAVARQPCLRVRWKPDIRHLHAGVAGQLDGYVSEFVAQCRDADMELADDERLAAMGALVDLAGHLNPRMSILELGDSCSCKAKKLMGLLGDGTGFRRCKSWDSGRLDESGAVKLQECDGDSDAALEGPFDLLFVHRCQDVWESPEALRSILSEQGIVVARSTAAAREALGRGHFAVTDLPGSKVILATRLPEEKQITEEGRDVLFVVNEPSAAAKSFAGALQANVQIEGGVASARTVALRDIESVQIAPRTMCISLLELEQEFLASMDSEDMNRLRTITDTATTVLWLSGENKLGTQPNPDLSLSNGLSRALMLEQPALNFVVMDVGSIVEGDDTVCQKNVLQVLRSCLSSTIAEEDKEFAQKDGLLYISRFGPDFDINGLFRRRFEKHDSIVKTKLSAARPARLAIGTFGGSDTLHFEQVREPTSSLPSGYIDVQVKAVSLNAKDIYALKGRVETREATTALEFSGVVTAVGSDVGHLQPGDSVVVGMPSQFGTNQRVPAWAAQKMLPGEKFVDMATFPTIYGTSLYGLYYRANLRRGESILIHGGAGAFGFAAIQIAKRILGSTAKIYTTAGSDSKKKFIATELGVPESNIFNSRDTSFAAGIKSATGGKGVNVVINFLTGDQLKASWECVAPFGRFIEIGKRDLLDAGKLDMHVFLRNATFTAFDFSDLYYQQMQYQDETFSNLLGEMFELYRAGEIRPPPIKTFDAGEIVEAYRHFSSEDRLGKVVISFENEDSKIPLAPSKFITLLDPQKVYLLIGCLGGLGRSLSRWMVSRGARNFVFLGRSGCDKPSARELVNRLEHAGANVSVVRGDVTSRADVDAAVAACAATGKKLGGVIQAAMGLHEALFSRMENKDWHTGIQPKWTGTWNLHRAIEAHEEDLDFFLMTSSLSGSVGTATESNYCAANGFLDSFARWRRSQGKTATSVGFGMISEVGYLHENPEIEALLLRKGIQPLNEAEFLQVTDLALAGVGENPVNAREDDRIAASHILTGLEPLGFRQLLSQGYDVSFSSASDPRMAILAAALAAEQDAEKERSGAATGGPVAAAEWFEGVPAHARAAITPEASAETLQAAVMSLVRKRFSSLILTPADQIDDGKPLARFGVDSMIASEFRTWFWTAFKVDVPFLDILSPEKNLGTLAEFASEKLVTA